MKIKRLSKKTPFTWRTGRKAPKTEGEYFCIIKYDDTHSKCVLEFCSGVWWSEGTVVNAPDVYLDGVTIPNIMAVWAKDAAQSTLDAFSALGRAAVKTVKPARKLSKHLREVGENMDGRDE